jgi:hypothetical protein
MTMKGLIIAGLLLLTAPAYASKVEITLDHQTRLLLNSAIGEMTKMRLELEKMRREIEELRRAVEKK